MKYKLGIIGIGNMARSILKGLEKDFEDNILLSSIDFENLAQLKSHNIDIINNNIYLAKNSQYIMLAVKPDSASVVLDEIKPYVTEKTVIISVMAGVKVSYIKNYLPNIKSAVRIMSNLAAKISQACTGISFYDADKEVKDFILKIFKQLGSVIVLDEDKLDAVTALSGSGLAYVYYYVDAMIKAGVNIGLSAEESRLIALQTFTGAVEMIRTNNQNIEDMITAVCSKGGTTIEAISVFNQNNLQKIIDDGVTAAYKKSKKLSGNIK